MCMHSILILALYLESNCKAKHNYIATFINSSSKEMWKSFPCVFVISILAEN